MSRIDDALRRAAGDAAPQEQVGTALASYPDETAGRPAADAPTVAVEPRPALQFVSFRPDLLEKIVVTPDSSPHFAEQFRKLAATLHQLQLDRGVKSVMVTSSLAAEGKTLTAVNLALTLATSYHRRVLLVDADLRRPAMQEIFQIPSVSGLSDGLSDEEDRSLTVFEVGARLVLLPAGKPTADPMGLLTSARMRRILTEATASFDWIVVDTPPVLALPDAHLLGAMVDVAVLVVEAGRTPAGLVTKALETLGRDRVAGVVLNKADNADVPDYGYGYAYKGSEAAKGASAPNLDIPPSRSPRS